MLNPIEKFREFWQTLTPVEQSDLYVVLSAIRGPDLVSLPLKERYTRPIRKLLLGEEDGAIFSRNHEGIYPPLTSDHFMWHALYAESILKFHGFNKVEIVEDLTSRPTRYWSKSDLRTEKAFWYPRTLYDTATPCDPVTT